MALSLSLIFKVLTAHGNNRSSAYSRGIVLATPQPSTSRARYQMDKVVSTLLKFLSNEIPSDAEVSEALVLNSLRTEIFSFAEYLTNLCLVGNAYGGPTWEQRKAVEARLEALALSLDSWSHLFPKYGMTAIFSIRKVTEGERKAETQILNASAQSHGHITLLERLLERKLIEVVGIYSTSLTAYKGVTRETTPQFKEALVKIREVTSFDETVLDMTSSQIKQAQSMYVDTLNNALKPGYLSFKAVCDVVTQIIGKEAQAEANSKLDAKLNEVLTSVNLSELDAATKLKLIELLAKSPA